MVSELNFDDLAVIETSVQVAGKSYVLREASGDAACKYRNAMLASTELGPEGKPRRLAGMASADPLLVSLCLFYADSGKSVSEKIIRAWPNRVQKAMYTWIKENSELDEEENTVESLQKQRIDIDEQIARLKEDAVGNVPSAMEDGSS